MRIRHWIAWGLLVLVVLGVGGAAWALSAAGYQKFVVKTGSMSPTIKPGDLVIDRAVNGELAVGDVITFRDSQSELVTHRIADISSEGITTKGDANETADVSRVQRSDVVGVVAFVIPKGGYVVLFLGQPTGLISVVVAVVGLVLLWRLFFPSNENQVGSATAGVEPDHAPAGDSGASDGPMTTDSDAPGLALSADGKASSPELSTGRHSAADDDDSEIDIPGADYLEDGEPAVSGVDALSSERTSST